MDIKKRVDVKPKKLERTVKTFTRATKAVNKAQTVVRKGANAKKSADRQAQNSGENEGAYATNRTMQSVKDVRKRAIKAPYKALKKEMYRRQKNSVRFNVSGGHEPTSALRLSERNSAHERARSGTGRRDPPAIKTRSQTSAGRQETVSRLNERNASTGQARVRNGTGRKEAPAIKTRLQTSASQKEIPASLKNQTIHAKKRNAFRKNSIKNHVERTRRAVKSAKKGFEAIVNGAMAVFRGGKTIWLLIAAAGGNVVVVACIIAIVAAILSPFAFLFGGNNSVDEHPSLAEVANDINAEYTAKFKSIIDDHDDVDEIEIRDYEIDSANYVASNWKDILSIWSVNNDIYRGEKKTDDELQEIDPDKPAEQEELPYIMTDHNITLLTNMFWQMNDITYEIKTEKVEVDQDTTPEPTATPKPSQSPKPSSSPSATSSPEPTPKTKTVKTLIITPISRDYLWGADNYNFDDDQREWLEDLMGDQFAKEWSMLLLGITGTEMTDTQKQLLEDLPTGPGATIAYKASTRLGHPYSKAKRGQGLYVDCSYLARWCYREAGYDWFTPATAAEQARWCNNNGYVVERSELKAGDLLFYSFAKNGRYKNISHVAVYIGRASDGKEYMIDASSSNGFVIYREVFSEKNLVMCGRPLMYLN